MSLLLIDLAYLGIKGATSLSWFVVKNSYNLVAYTVGAEQIADPTPTNETQELLTELRSLRKEVHQLKSQMEYINDQTYQLVDPNCLDATKDESEVLPGGTDRSPQGTDDSTEETDNSPEVSELSKINTELSEINDELAELTESSHPE